MRSDIKIDDKLMSDTQGVTVRKTINTLIAPRCIESRYTLLHNDWGFEPFVMHLGLKSVF